MLVKGTCRGAQKFQGNYIRSVCKKFTKQTGGLPIFFRKVKNYRHKYVENTYNIENSFFHNMAICAYYRNNNNLF